MAQDQVQSMVGREMGSYKVLSLLGTGGMGEVYLAQDRKLDRKVALKVLPEEMQRDETARRRLLHEAKSAAALDNPYVCNIFEIGEAEDKDFISMEYVQGETLKDKLAEGPLALRETLQLAAEISEALEEAHKQGIVHRDLKPSNIMLTPQGHAKVMDFGLAKQLISAEGVGDQEQTLSANLTKTGTTLGTLAYMSPEQLRGEEVDTRSDVFSFGVLLYEMIAGVNPFLKPQRMETASAILRDEPSPLSTWAPEVPERLEQIVKEMLAKQADGRYQSSRELLADLKVLQQRIVSGHSPAVAVLQSLRKPQVAIPALLLLLALAVGAGWWIHRSARVRWAKQEALPEIERLVEGSWRDLTEAYKLAEQAEEHIPNDPKLSELFSKCSFEISIKTTSVRFDVVDSKGLKVHLTVTV